MYNLLTFYGLFMAKLSYILTYFKNNYQILTNIYLGFIIPEYRVLAVVFFISLGLGKFYAGFFVPGLQERLPS